MATSQDLALLTTCADTLEAGALRSRLEAEGIHVVVRGEQHNAVMGIMTSGLVEVEVLVPTSALEQARNVIAPEEEPGADIIPGTSSRRCVEHGADATDTCARCGKFVCEACAAGTPGDVLCTSCEAKLIEEMPRKTGRRRSIAAVMLFIFLAGPGLIALLYRLVASMLFGAE